MYFNTTNALLFILNILKYLSVNKTEKKNLKYNGIYVFFLIAFYVAFIKKM